MGPEFLTVAIPIHPDRVEAVTQQLVDMGNPARAEFRKRLGRKGIHFLSMNVIPLDDSHPPFLLIEATTDCGVLPSTLIDALGMPLVEVFFTAGLLESRKEAEKYILRLFNKFSCPVGQSLFSRSGVCFSGTPGMSVDRIFRENRLARIVGDEVKSGRLSGTSLQILQAARKIIQKSKYADLLQVHVSPLLGQPQATSLPVTVALRGLWLFTWPYWLLMFSLVAAMGGVGWLYLGFLQGLVIGLAGLVLGGAIFIALCLWIYATLRRIEKSDVPDQSQPDARKMARILELENRYSDQNHLFGVSVMKGGFVRELMLKIVFWRIVQAVTWLSCPGFLNRIGTIHSARWVRIKGTNKLIFLSNYSGSWESYLEDFITLAPRGLTGVWSNTVGFPRTKNLFQEGAMDGENFKRWARRQQYPTLFWYSANPSLTTQRIRLNAAIRQGLVSATTADEADDWLACFGSRPRGSHVLETREIQSILFGGFKYLNSGACLLFRLPASPDDACRWLAQTEREISFGDMPPRKQAVIMSLTKSGLIKLGFEDRIVREFPIAFQEGMATSHRSRILGDTGDDKPETWAWGNSANPVDVALLLYTDGDEPLILEGLVEEQKRRILECNGEFVQKIDLPTYVKDGPIQEPFGFVDGISQPIIRGTRRWMKEHDQIHAVEPGEFLLGYRDNRGYPSLSPTVPATLDPNGVLPKFTDRIQSDLPDFKSSGGNALRDLGRNGSYVVIRQLEQDVASFERFLTAKADELKGKPGVPPQLDPSRIKEWLAAKMVGRWRNGSSLVKFPHKPGGTKESPEWNSTLKQVDCAKDSAPIEEAKQSCLPRVEPDNSFLFGAEDPLGMRCPFGAHIRRSNPRESLNPDSPEQLSITNRHRILRFGRNYRDNGQQPGRQGILFMCLNADIERQFEFIQQTWALARLFHGLDNEVDPIMGRGAKGGQLTIPTEHGPLRVTGIQDFVRVRGGGYFFLPSRRAIQFLCGSSSAAQEPVQFKRV